MTDYPYELLDKHNSPNDSFQKIIMGCMYIGILTIVLLIFLSCISGVIYFTISRSKSPNNSTYPQKNITIINFEHFTIEFNLDKQYPIRSTQFSWVLNPPSSRGGWNNNISRITTEDYKNISYNGELMDRGHLSPYNVLGRESMTIVNAVPQYRCHNRGIWRMFEEYVKNNYQNETIITYPLYRNNYQDIIHTLNGDLYVPTDFCKNIRGLEYCMYHSRDVCYKKWCHHLSRNLTSDC
eukprot:gene2768-4176_t